MKKGAIEILRAGVSNNITGEKIDVLDLVRKYAAAGNVELAPKQFLSKELDIYSRARLMVEWTYNGKRHSDSISWFSTIKLIVEEE